MEHTGSCYWLQGAGASMAEAKVTCAGLQGIVAELESPGEFLNVNEVLNGLDAEVWVGLTKDTVSGVFFCSISESG